MMYLNVTEQHSYWSVLYVANVANLKSGQENLTMSWNFICANAPKNSIYYSLLLNVIQIDGQPRLSGEIYD